MTDKALNEHTTDLNLLNEIAPSDLKRVAMHSANLFTNAISQMDKKEALGWLAYLGEALEEDAGLDTVENLCSELQDRIQNGSW